MKINFQIAAFLLVVLLVIYNVLSLENLAEKEQAEEHLAMNQLITDGEGHISPYGSFALPSQSVGDECISKNEAGDWTWRHCADSASGALALKWSNTHTFSALLISGEAPSCLLTIRGKINDQEEELVCINHDGTLKYGPNYNPDWTAQIFWETMASGYTRILHKQKIKNLRHSLEHCRRK